ncbi:MAG: Zn-ribbon domain-containing OB-fold protein [Candidatus Dormibacteria bacterium]
MTESASPIPWDDPTTRAFWEAAYRHQLLVQRCQQCGHHQFYPRPFCLQCEAAAMAWMEAAGTGFVYTQTEVHLRVVEGLEPPYVCALVELDEGPRLLTNISAGRTTIGSRVRVAWRPRVGAPPLPVFEAVDKP